MKMGNVLGDLLIALAAAFTVYLCVVMARRIRAVVLKDDYIRVFGCELIACVLFLLLALDARFGIFTAPRPGALRGVGWGLRCLVILASAALLFFMGRIAAGSLKRQDAPARSALVLGLALENGRPTDDLIARLDTAEAYWRRYPDAVLILTGGNPGASGKTEAAVMREILLERGVAEEKLALEDQAATTKENFKNAALLVDPGAPIALITSNYHMDRAVQTAKSAGFASVLRQPAPSSALYFGANVMWETVLEVNELAYGRGRRCFRLRENQRRK